MARYVWAAAPATTSATTVNGGTLTLLGNFQLPGTLTIGASGGVVNYAGSATTDYSNSLTMTNGGTLTVDLVSAPTTVTYATAFGNSTTGGISKSGLGTLILSPASGGNTYTGATTVGAGTLALNFVENGTANDILAQTSSLQLQGGAFQVNGKISGSAGAPRKLLPRRTSTSAARR